MLVRAAHHSDLLELTVRPTSALPQVRGPAVPGSGTRQRLRSAARLLDNSHDEVAWFRLLRLHDRLGPSSARSITAAIVVSGDDPIDKWPEVVASAPAPARNSLSSTLTPWLTRGQIPFRRRGRQVCWRRCALCPDEYADAAVRLLDLERLAGAAAGAPDLAAWLAEVVLDPPASTGDLAGPPDLDEDYVIVSTIHSAKGLEWSIVHIPQVVDGSIPIDMALGSPAGLDEERRLFYVAVTGRVRS